MDSSDLFENSLREDIKKISLAEVGKIFFQVIAVIKESLSIIWSISKSIVVVAVCILLVLKLVKIRFDFSEFISNLSNDVGLRK